jgi:hypothetical protein
MKAGRLVLGREEEELLPQEEEENPKVRLGCWEFAPEKFSFGNCLILKWLFLNASTGLPHARP